MKDQETVRKTLDRSDYVLDYQDADALVPDLLNHLRDSIDLHVIQTGHHLVEQKQFWFHRERLRQLQPFAVRPAKFIRSILDLFA